MSNQIPVEHRFPELNKKLDQFALATHAIKEKVPSFDVRQSNIFTALVRPWLLERSGITLSSEEEFAKDVGEKAGFNAALIADDIETIFQGDKHLRECCDQPLALAFALDELYVRRAVELMSEGLQSHLGQLFAQFEETVYGHGPFTRVAYSHLFNFSSPLERIEVGPLIIQKARPEEISSFLGRGNASSEYLFLHPLQVGSFFIVHEETGTTNDLFEWLWSSYERAIELFRVVQYHKTGVTYVDYCAPHFKPPWVNYLRKFGLFFVGSPRRLPYLNGNKLFEITAIEMPHLQRRMRAFLSPAIQSHMADETAPFRHSSLRAGDYYEASLAEERPSARLIALAIALESLFSPGNVQEISFKTNLAATQLLGNNSETKRKIFADLKDLYDRRSRLMHGDYPVKKVYEGTFVTHPDIDRWSDYIRDSILRFLTLFFRGKRTDQELREFRQKLWMCAVDGSDAGPIREETDLDRFILELESKI